MAGYLKLSAACLTTTFILTQRTGACRRIAGSENAFAKDALLPDLLAGRTFATVGISHLTTSRRHLAKPVLRATETDKGFLLDGYSPWVTGASEARTVVLGATMEDGRQILMAVPTDSPGVKAAPAERMIALTASHTGPVHLDAVEIDREWLLAGPVENVMSQGVGGKTGGVETSCLAVGLANAAIKRLQREAAARPDLVEPAQALSVERDEIREALFAIAAGDCGQTPAEIRARANSLVLRATQATLAAAKGAGYLVDHPAGRWCREALFFLVWSCPPTVMSANLCELAGLAD